MFKKRTIFSQIWQKIDSPDILVLNGARQVGKTTVLLMIKEKLVKEKKVKEDQIHWFGLERIDDLSVWSNQQTALALLPLKDKKQHYIFIDEFQKSKNVGSILKVLHDHYSNFKIIATCSASWYLTIDESMAGRKQIFNLWPLSFSEYIDWQDDKKLLDYYNLALSDVEKASPEIINYINNYFINFLTYGGYPRVVLSQNKNDKINILLELINSYLMRDIQIWNYAANVLQIKKILTLLASKVSSLLDINSLSVNTGLGRNALINRLEFLQNTFILYLSKPFFTNKTKELIKNPKIYLIDSGLRNSLLQNFSVLPKTQEFGQISENFVITEMYKKIDAVDQIFYWRTKNGQEVDLIKKREKKILPVEVKAGDITNIPENLKTFIRIYKPKKAIILNWSVVKEEVYQNCEVKYMPLCLV